MMQVVLLAGGLGSRIAEESSVRPKPMIEIGGRPILWHIMKIYSHHGFRDFIICLGYKGYMIKEYFMNFYLHHSDVTIDTANNKVIYHQSTTEPWQVTLVDTGDQTLTGGRLLRVRSFITNETFCLTYGDGLADLDVRACVAFHQAHGKLATMTAVVPPGRYGAVDLDRDQVRRFVEKPPGDQGYVNGGFFVLNQGVIDRIADDTTAWEGAPLESLAFDGELCAYRHRGFWHAMDTLRDRNYLEELWLSGRAPWKMWK
jgi:glucose-1-phosphate cytidylyltransferase